MFSFLEYIFCRAPEQFFCVCLLCFVPNCLYCWLTHQDVSHIFLLYCFDNGLPIAVSIIKWVLIQMLIDLINMSRSTRASSPSLQLSRRSLTSLSIMSCNLKGVDCSDAGVGPSLKMVLLALVSCLRSLRLWLLPSLSCPPLRPSLPSLAIFLYGYSTITQQSISLVLWLLEQNFRNLTIHRLTLLRRIRWCLDPLTSPSHCPWFHHVIMIIMWLDKKDWLIDFLH